jgi:hypothetical protein
MDFLPPASPAFLTLLGGLSVFIPSLLMFSLSGFPLSRKTMAAVILTVISTASAFTALGGLFFTEGLPLNPFVVMLGATVLGAVAGYGVRRFYIGYDPPLRAGPTGRG